MRAFHVGKKRIAVVVFALLLSGCATEKELENRSLGRFVQKGVYENPLVGYRFNMPSPGLWKYVNLPEFDVSFNHVEGKAQVFISGIRRLVRREFPDGFIEWIFNRLRARHVSPISRQQINSSMDEEFQLFYNCKFSILPREDFGVDRKVAVFTKRQKDTWVALVYLAPETSFDEILPEVTRMASDIQITFKNR